MKLILELDGTESRGQAQKVLSALAGIYGIPVAGTTNTIELRVDSSALAKAVDEVVADLKQAASGDRDVEVTVTTAPGVTAVLRDRPPTHAEGAFGDLDVKDIVIGVEDDPAAILAAAQAGAAPLAEPADAPSPAGAPASSNAPGAAPGTSTELDADGLPWDEAIHSSSHGKVKDGTWRKRSKLAEGVYEARIAELRVHYPKPVSQIPPPPPPASATGGGSAFAALIERLHAAHIRAESPVTKDAQNAAMAELGVVGLEGLSKRPDLFATFAEKLGL